jgi:hypothetical protein
MVSPLPFILCRALNKQTLATTTRQSTITRLQRPTIIAYTNYTVRTMTTQGTRFKLNTGGLIPALGFGTWNDAEHMEGATSAALKAGYKHIDTARMYVG